MYGGGEEGDNAVNFSGEAIHKYDNLPEGDGIIEPDGLSYRGQNLITGKELPEECGRCFGSLSREPGVLLLWRVVTLFEQCGVCHTLDSRHGAATADRIKLKAQGNADWA